MKKISVLTLIAVMASLEGQVNGTLIKQKVSIKSKSRGYPYNDDGEDVDQEPEISLSMLDVETT